MPGSVHSFSLNSSKVQILLVTLCILIEFFLTLLRASSTKPVSSNKFHVLIYDNFFVQGLSLEMTFLNEPFPASFSLFSYFVNTVSGK